MAEAVEEALREWRVRGVPPNPGGWLTQAARHNALDRLRRESRYRDKLALLGEPPPSTTRPSASRTKRMSACRSSSAAATRRSPRTRSSL